MGNEIIASSASIISMVEEADFVHVLGKKKKKTTTGEDEEEEEGDDNLEATVVTPATSTSSSPSLLPSSNPPAIEEEGFESLDIHNDDDEKTNEASRSNDRATTRESSWNLPASRKSSRTHNPIRAIVDPIMANSIKSGEERGDGKDQISLALGDPTASGDIPPCPAVVAAVQTALRSPGAAAGYVDARGTYEARAAIANYHHHRSSNVDGAHRRQARRKSGEEDGSSSFVPREDLSREEDSVEGGKDDTIIGNEGVPTRVQVTAEDVIVASGASGALELALTAMLDEGTVLLVPRPGFPLYCVIAESHGASVAHYDLLPDRGWECDLDDMERTLQDPETEVRGIVVNNPSNPTGAVYSEEHLARIVELAGRYRVPIVADEIYGDVTFGRSEFVPMADVAARAGYEVPVITASGLGKQYLVPGWRLGWIVFQDNRHGAIREVAAGAWRLAQVVLGASRLAQAAVPAVLAPSSDEDALATAGWREGLRATMEGRARAICGALDGCHGLHAIFPEGAMYAMVRIDVDAFDDSVVDDVSFMRLLLEEENVVVLPGRAFGMVRDRAKGGDTGSSGHVFRVAFCASEDVLVSAAERISSFCLRHGS